MENFFIDIFNLSVSASWLVLAIIIFRFLFKKAPRWLNCALWAVVGIRLVFPFSIESVLSLVPSAQTVPPEIVYEQEPYISSGVSVLNSVVNPVVGVVFAPDPAASINPIQIALFIASCVWIAGVCAMFGYALGSYLRLRVKMKTATLYEGNIYQSELVESPFVLGFFRPKIYIPYSVSPDDIPHVIAHENAHIRRKDHFIKPLSFLILSVYWFNPVIWAAYVLLCRDIELACDEKVVKDMEESERKQYSYALLNCSVNRRIIAACPLAFGEVGVKDRIKSVMNYKKPAFWVIVAAAAVSVIIAVCFLTNPAGDKLVEVEALSFPSVGNASVATSGGIFETSDPAETARAVEFAKSVRVDKRPVSQDRSDTREAVHTVSFTANGSDIENYCFFTLNFNRDCTEVWINNFVKPTLTYKVKKPAEALKFFAEHDVYCSTFVAGELLYSSGMFSTVGGVKGNYFYNFDSGMHFSEKTSGVLGWETLGKMSEYKLDEYNFDGTLTGGVEYDFSPSEIRRENKKAWRIVTGEPDNYSYILLEQKNGDLIMVKGFGNHSTRWVFKLEKAFTDAPRSLDAAVSETVLWKEDAVYADDWRSFESHYVADKISEKTETGELITAYVLTLCEIYFLEDDGTLMRQYSSAKPVMMTFEKLSDGSHILKDYQEYNVKSNPEASKKIEQLFPEAINADYGREIVYMQDGCYEKAAAYFNIRDYAVRYDVKELMPVFPMPYDGTQNELYLRALNREKLSVNYEQHMPVFKFDSLAELVAFRDEYSAKINFDEPFDECPSFNTYISKFTDDYFRNNSLLLIIATEPSCSFRHQVGGVVVNGRQLKVTVNTITVSPFAEAMGCWAVPVQLSKNVTDACDSFDAVKGVEVERKVVAKYSYAESTEAVSPYLVLYNNNQYDFCYSMLSSGYPRGGYEYRDGDYLVLTANYGYDTPRMYRFRIDGNELIFDAKHSFPIPEYKLDGGDKPPRSPVPDGAVFVQ